MKRLILLAAGTLLAACSQDDLVLPTLPDETPFHQPREIRIETGYQLDTVPLDLVVHLSFQPGAYVQYFWALEVPPGSAATLDDPAAPEPSFTPDVEGVYVVRVSTRVGPDLVEQTSRNLTATIYRGRESCVLCHSERVASAALTAHGRTLENHAATLFATPGCLNCHVLGANVAETVPAPGGWDDIAEAVGFDPATYPFTTYAQFAADQPALADRGAVQCENCHGAANLHESDPRRVEVSTDARVCGECHSSFGPRYLQWEFSPHAKSPPPDAVNDPDCARCHTATAFARTVNGRPLRELPESPPGVACAACHDPHDPQNPSETRLFGSVDLAVGGAFECGRAAACVQCHQTEIADPAAHASANLRFPCAVQAEMLAGRGAVEYGTDDYESSFHGDPGFKLRNFTGNPEDPLWPEACVTCHMAPTPASGPDRDRLGGHTILQSRGSSELVIGNCDRCHAGLTTFDRNVGRDYDGDGTAEGIQTEIRGLLERVHTALEADDTLGGLSRPGGPGTEIVVSGDLTLTTPALREGAYNHNFVVRDGSFGVHNTFYAVQVLQRTWESVEGVSFQTAFPGAYVP
jgi:hypothetical protein